MAEEKVTTTATECQETAPATPSIEELQAAIAELQAANAKLKEATNTASSQAAEYKKKWRDTLSDAERQAQETAEARAREKAELEALRTEKRVSGYTARLMGCGFDEATAKVMAAALPENIGDEYFEVQKSFIAGKEAAIRSDLLKSQSGVGGGKAPDPAPTENDRLRKYFGL